MYNVTYETKYLIEGTLKWKTDNESTIHAIVNSDDFEAATVAVKKAWFADNERKILEKVNISYILHITKLEHLDTRII